MKIKNSTDWKTSDIRKLLRECFLRTGMSHEKHTIEIVTGHYSGLGKINGLWMRLRLPPVIKLESFYGSDGRKHTIPADNQLDMPIFAETIFHELAHNRGIKHKDMSRMLMRNRKSSKTKEEKAAYFSWANEFKINPSEHFIKVNSS